jgi:large subunit ribosomal protein L16
LIRKNLKKKSKIWIYFSPNVTITKKPNETRMGKGKGPVKYWSFLIKKNQLLFEFIGMNKSIVQKTVKASKVKLPFNTTFLTRY